LRFTKDSDLAGQTSHSQSRNGLLLITASRSTAKGFVEPVEHALIEQ